MYKDKKRVIPLLEIPVSFFEKRIMKYIFFSGIISSMVFSSVFVAHASGNQSPWAEEALSLVNEERQAYGIPALKASATLSRAASEKLSDMEREKYFAHTSPRNLTPWHFIEQAGYSYSVAGENLAISFMDPRAEHKAWMQSEKHCQNILDPRFQESGIAVRKIFFGGRETIVAVEMFGTALSEQGSFDPSGKKIAQALCQKIQSSVLGASSDGTPSGPLSVAGGFLMKFPVFNSSSGDSLASRMMRSPYGTLEISALVLFALAQMTAIAAFSGVLLAREREKGVFS